MGQRSPRVLNRRLRGSAAGALAGVLALVGMATVPAGAQASGARAPGSGVTASLDHRLGCGATGCGDASADRLTLSGTLPGLSPDAAARQLTAEGAYLAIGDLGRHGVTPPLASRHFSRRFAAAKCHAATAPQLAVCNGNKGDTLTLATSSGGVAITAVAHSQRRGGDGLLSSAKHPAVVQVAIGSSLVQLTTGGGSCSSSTQSGVLHQVCTATASPPVGSSLRDGPLSTGEVQMILQEPAVDAPGATANPDGCGSMYSKVGNTALLASGFVSLVPTVGPGLGVALLRQSAHAQSMGVAAGDSCIKGEFSVMNQQLSDQQLQIEQLQQQAQTFAATFYQNEFDQSLATTGTYALLYASSLNNLSPSNQGTEGIFGNFMINSDFWQYGDVPTPDATVATAATGQNFQNAVGAANADAPAFQSDIANLSGTSLNVSKCTTGDCYQQVTQNPTSQVVGLWQSKAQLLQAAWLQAIGPGTASGSNAVPLYDSYNNSISSDFQSSLNALQQGLQLETLSNQMNLQYAQASCSDPSSWASCTQIPSWGAVPGTSFSVARLPVSATTWDDVINAYNADQKQLVQVYAARADQLLQNALQFLMTDGPIGPQAFPTSSSVVSVNGTSVTVPPVAYQKDLGAALPQVIGGPARTPLTSLPAALGGSWTSAAALYQFSALFDVNTCAASVHAFNEAPGGPLPASQVFADPSSCPPVFTSSPTPSMDQAYYDGDRIQPYYASSAGIVLTGAIQANVRMCNPSAPAFGWYQPPIQYTGNAAGLVAGAWYLNCGNGAQITTNPITCFPDAHCPVSWNAEVASPWAWGESQYYGTPADYPDLKAQPFTIKNGESTQNVYFQGVFGTGPYTGLVPFYESVSGSQHSATAITVNSKYYAETGLAFSSPTSNQNTWYQGVTAIPTNNVSQVIGAMGVFIPVGWILYYTAKGTYQVGVEPEQGTTIAEAGFTCSGLTCTTADGRQWTVSTTPYLSPPYNGVNIGLAPPVG